MISVSAVYTTWRGLKFEENNVKYLKKHENNAGQKNVWSVCLPSLVWLDFEESNILIFSNLQFFLHWFNLSRYLSNNEEDITIFKSPSKGEGRSEKNLPPPPSPGLILEPPSLESSSNFLLLGTVGMYSAIFTKMIEILRTQVNWEMETLLTEIIYNFAEILYAVPQIPPRRFP